ncbi:hypothetical protein ENU1_189280 [Entamoeba nuttalli P19]|uniref:Uncharacterized protein n=1 Tax=Entamoeba nuttalli (strain P19) TaxID=1076696 RepID=K2GV52_ENTNP|nr:hypothetical protein ENU1_189280 [Entamoeba nuttalli P19]EKE37697.1 hypothetical protein ENU1_189280 [Entamoeba nuttalli P19]|eukprot:XP_008859968.1 hypothetical protein ENU1_189280 [Entamoeba nuttalli P19]
MEFDELIAKHNIQMDQQLLESVKKLLKHQSGSYYFVHKKKLIIQILVDEHLSIHVVIRFGKVSYYIHSSTKDIDNPFIGTHQKAQHCNLWESTSLYDSVRKLIKNLKDIPIDYTERMKELEILKTQLLNNMISLQQFKNKFYKICVCQYMRDIAITNLKETEEEQRKILIQRVMFTLDNMKKNKAITIEEYNKFSGMVKKKNQEKYFYQKLTEE